MRQEVGGNHSIIQTVTFGLTDTMLTPRFSLSQDADFVYINIIVPYIKLAESDCYVHDDEFYFYSSPYYLRLHLPGKIREDQLSTSQYNVDTGELTVRVSKETKGDDFDGLDLLTKLLTPKKATNTYGELEVIDDEASKLQDNGPSDEGADENELEFDWFVEQKVNDAPSCSLTTGPSYGFANRKTNILNVLMTELPDLLDLKDPDNVPASERRTLREQQERDAFSCEHYLADLFDDEMIRDLISPDYAELTGTVGEKTVLTDAEKEKLLQLPRREYLLDDSELKTTYLGLVDLVFAFAYNFRFTQGEPNVESDWTICKLSATLSWLDSFDNVKDVIISCARRSLIFPLYCNWKLFYRVFNDVKTIFQTGKSQVLKCLLGIQKTLAESDVRYPLNNLYITDYCVWLQSADSKIIESIYKALSELKISKSDLDLRLDEMEADAKTLMDDCDDGNQNCSDCDKAQDDDDVNRLAQSLCDVVRVTESTVGDSDDEESESDDDDGDEESDDDDGDEESESDDDEESDSDDEDENQSNNEDGKSEN